MQTWTLLLGLSIVGAAFGTPQAPSLAGAPAPAMVTIRFELAPKGDSRELRGTLVLSPLPSGEPVVVTVEAGAVPDVALPEGSRWALGAQIPGYWTPQRVVAVEGWRAGRAELLALWPTATLKGVLKLSSQARAESFVVRIEDAPFSQASLPRADIACSLDEKLRFRCDVPAGELDVSFRAKGLIPVYRWGIALKPGEEKPVGELVLKKGSSLSGWVEVDGGRVALGCRAKLRTVTAGPPVAPSLSHRVAKAGNEAPVNLQGFFQLAGVAPGSYVLVVEQPGFAPAEVAGLDIWPDSETALQQPVLLQRPLELEIAIDPPLDWLQRPWRVEVLRAHDFAAGMDRRPEFDGLASEEGLVQVKGQRPGRYTVMVSDSLGNRWASDPLFEVTRENARRDIHIEVVSVHGLVTYGKEPLAATLWFGGRFGGERVEMTSDAEGQFHGVLPRGGTWRVELSVAEPRLETKLSVEVKPNRDGEAKVDVRLPDTVVFGRVLNEQGEALAGAEVSFTSVIGAVEAESDAEGRFETRALPEGRLLLSAQVFTPRGKLMSEEVGFELAEGQPVGPLDLVVRATKPLVGRVESLRGPVVGGSVLVYSQVPRMGASAVARTDLTGAFSVAVPGQALRLTAVVSPPGRALKAFDLPAMIDPVVLHVPEEGGRLELELPPKADRETEGVRVLVIHQDGLYLPLGDLLRWAMGHGVSMYEGRHVHVPSLAPGRYEACLTPAGLPVDPGAWKTAETICAAGTLYSGDTLQLRLDQTRTLK